MAKSNMNKCFEWITNWFFKATYDQCCKGYNKIHALVVKLHINCYHPNNYAMEIVSIFFFQMMQKISCILPIQTFSQSVLDMLHAFATVSVEFEFSSCVFC